MSLLLIKDPDLNENEIGFFSTELLTRARMDVSLVPVCLDLSKDDRCLLCKAGLRPRLFYRKLCCIAGLNCISLEATKFIISVSHPFMRDICERYVLEAFREAYGVKGFFVVGQAPPLHALHTHR